jgi:Ca2+:H+ antiporter
MTNRWAKLIFRDLRQKPFLYLVLAIPLAFLAKTGGWSPLWVFALSALSVVPLASLIGESTEVLAHYTGPRVGGLLNATLGNAAELIITIVAIRAGLLDLVKASITGSILGNLLLVLGMSMLLGGLRNGVQTFDRKQASNNSILLVLTVLILTIPSLLSHYIGADNDPKVEILSLGVAAIMVVLYGLGLLYSFKVIGGPLTPETPNEEVPYVTWSARSALVVLVLSTVGVALLSEILVGAVEPVVEGLGISEFFVGIIFIPIIGNVAEHLVAVQVAIRNKMTLSVEVAVASSLQVALFVVPVLVFLSLLLGHPLTLIFTQFELLALGAGVLIAALVSADGESNWLEGVELLAIYLILGLAFMLIPVSDIPVSLLP